MLVKKNWDGLFLEERPSVSLCLFRIAVGFTAGAHVLPTLFHLQDNYLARSFREKNFSFFTPGVIQWIDQSPDWLVILMAGFFTLFLITFTVGFLSQISCILLMLCSYYFYALNSLHIGTLSWDIFLVTLFLMCITHYHGDSFSVDSRLKRRPEGHRIKRPFFVQRLLQLQLAFTYFYTGLGKITGTGNWLADNPIYYLVRSVPESVVKEFPFRDWLGQHPDLCHKIGIAVICLELSMPFLLFIRRTRYLGIFSGFVFHWLLLVTLHVPTIFFFLFPPQFLLFVDPEKVSGWIDRALKGKNRE